jgi:hypothetical protein
MHEGNPAEQLDTNQVGLECCACLIYAYRYAHSQGLSSVIHAGLTQLFIKASAAIPLLRKTVDLILQLRIFILLLSV